MSPTQDINNPPKPLVACASRTPRPVGLVRQICMAALLIFLLSIIGSYVYFTRSAYVRELAQSYLSRLVGGQVIVRKVGVTIFEGVRLEDVRVLTGPADRDDSTIFTARTLILRANPRALLRGRLEPTQIIALDPHVRLCENLDRNQWNYQRLSKPRDPDKPRRPLQTPRTLPQILLRAGLIEYSRIHDGALQSVNTMAIDGQLNHAGGSVYSFDLDSRALDKPAGPRLSGLLNTEGPTITATLQNLEFDDSIRVMLPSQVQQWWSAHQLTGRVRIPRLEYTPAGKAQAHNWRVDVQLEQVSLVLLPEQLMGRVEYEKASRLRPGVPVDGLAHIGLTTRFAATERILRPQPVALSHVSGRVIFTPDRIRFCPVKGKVENNNVTFFGSVEGYSPESPFQLYVLATNLRIPELPGYMASMPPAVRKLHREYLPIGTANAFVEAVRRQPRDRVLLDGEVHILDGAFTFDDFPYPVRSATGIITLRTDEKTGLEHLELRNLRGLGVRGSPNENASVTLNGKVILVERGADIRLTVTGSDIWLDDHLRTALPRPARRSVAMFDIRPPDTRRQAPDEAGRNPDKLQPVQIHGSFETRVRRYPGPRRRLNIEVDLNIDSARGDFFAFPYPLRNASGQVLIRNDHVEFRDLRASHQDATLTVNGFVWYRRGEPVMPELTIDARNIPVARELLDALPPQQRQWLIDLGVDGKMDVAQGRVFLPPDARDTGQVDFRLPITLRDAALRKTGDTHVLTQATASLLVARDRVEVLELRGNRGGGKLVGCGQIFFPDDRPVFALAASATDLPVDSALYDLAPVAAQGVWNRLRPQGTVHLGITYSGGLEPAAAPTTDRPSIEGAVARLMSLTSTPGIDPQVAAGQPFTVTITPASLSMKPADFPWQMQKLGGQATVTPENIRLRDVSIEHGGARLAISGNVTANGAAELTASGASIPVDDELRQALPAGLRDFFTTMKVAGVLSFSQTKVEHSPAAGTGDQRKPAATRIDGLLELADGSLDIGIPLSEIRGGAQLKIDLLDGTINGISAGIDAAGLKAAGRPASSLKATLRAQRHGSATLYRFSDLGADFCGGKLEARRIDLLVPAKGPSSYGLESSMREVDVRQLTGDPDNPRGVISASLFLQGNWADPASRRGTGDVLVRGRDLYRIPIFLGLIQITNLSIPIKTPYAEATTRYDVQGQRVVFSRIELRNSNMLMSGSGELDFASRTVSLDLVTENEGWRIPGLDDLIQGIRKELLTIHVTGTVQEPQIKASSFDTVQTTIEHVTRPRKK